MALQKTDFQFMFVEAPSKASVSGIPVASGQFIITDDGHAFYDSSANTRVELSPDLVELLGNSIVTGGSVNAGSEVNTYVFTLSTIDPATGTTSTQTFTQKIDVATAVEEGNSKPVSSGAVKTYVDTEIETVKELAQQSSSEIYVVEGEANVAFSDVVFDEKQPDAVLKKGDLVVYTTPIDGTDAKSRSLYVYSGSEWIAADGSYTADNVYFTTDLTITADIGVQKIDSTGSATLGTKGKTVKQVFDMLLAQESAPKVKTAASASIKIASTSSGTVGTSNISVEAGTEVTPKYAASFNSGAYTYGPATGITVSGWSITDNLNAVTGGVNNSSTEASGSFESFRIAAGKSYKITAVATHTAGAVPVTNLGNAYDENHELYATNGAVQIPAGTKTANSATISAYQQGYYIGTVDNTTDAIDSELIRGLSKKKNGAYAAGNVTFSVPVGAARIIIACPKDEALGKVLNTTVNADMTTSFVKSSVVVAGADEDVNSDFAETYYVWVYQPAEAYGSAADLTITLK